MLQSVANNPTQLSQDSLEVLLQLTNEFSLLAGSAASQFISIMGSISSAISLTLNASSKRALTPTQQQFHNQTQAVLTNLQQLAQSLLSSVLCDQFQVSASSSGVEVRCFLCLPNRTHL